MPILLLFFCRYSEFNKDNAYLRAIPSLKLVLPYRSLSVLHRIMSDGLVVLEDSSITSAYIILYNLRPQNYQIYFHKS